jgi:signal transduction histidine kinase
MIRNREAFFFYCIQFLLLVVILAFGYFHLPIWSQIIVAFILMINTISFTHHRYKKIRDLGDYLSRINHRDYSLDIRDNTEGELSILKNELAKVMMTLRHQTDQSVHDKAVLAKGLSDISHQLKTPLTSLYIIADVIEDASLDNVTRKHFIDELMSQLLRMEWLVASLLKMARLDAEAIEMKHDEIDLGSLFRRTASLLSAMLNEKQQRLGIKTDESIRIYGDEAWLLEALTNLLKNAIEHSLPHGEILVRIEKNNLYAQVEIIDHGEGINPEDLPHIFERFYRGKNSLETSVGIGLALSKEILRKHNSEIEVNSVLNEGTIFKIKFYDTVKVTEIEV